MSFKVDKTPQVNQDLKYNKDQKVDNKNLTGACLYIKYVSALSIGTVPFLVAMIGLAIFKASAFLGGKVEKNIEKEAKHEHVYRYYPARIIGGIVRMIFGIPGFTGGLLFFGSSKIFSLSQQLVWGRKLVENPQGEKINTQLARYGFGNKPWGDFKESTKDFFNPKPLFYKQKNPHYDYLKKWMDWKIV